MLSQRAKKLVPSAVMVLGAKAQELKKQGKDVISLTLGEPSWDTPSAIKSAGIKAIKDGHTKYTPAGGSAELKSAIAEYTKKWLGLNTEPSQITASIGAKFILFSALQSLCDPEDEVLVPKPYWVSYPAQVELAGAKLVPLPTTPDHNFKLQPKTLSQHITKKSKVLILNSPNNPTGAVYSQKELKAIAEILIKHPQITILSDDIYNHLYFEGDMAPHILQVCPELKHRTLCINAVSKNYAMTGWRLGWAVGNVALISAMSRFQSQSVSCACSISQMATAFALLNCDKEVKTARDQLIVAKQRATKLFQQIKGLNPTEPEGTFYMWINMQTLFGTSYKGQKIKSSADFAEYLLQAKALLLVPGEAFDYPGYVRIHFAVEKQTLNLAASKIKDFIADLE